jgi:hypothetical protein
MRRVYPDAPSSSTYAPCNWCDFPVSSQLELSKQDEGLQQTTFLDVVPGAIGDLVVIVATPLHMHTHQEHDAVPTGVTTRMFHKDMQ